MPPAQGRGIASGKARLFEQSNPFPASAGPPLGFSESSSSWPMGRYKQSQCEPDSLRHSNRQAEASGATQGCASRPFSLNILDSWLCTSSGPKLSGSRVSLQRSDVGSPHHFWRLWGSGQRTQHANHRRHARIWARNGAASRRGACGTAERLMLITTREAGT